MKGPASAGRYEARWPVALSILTLLFLLTYLPERIRLYPSWLAHGAGVAVLIPLVGIGFTSARERWRHLERIVIFVFVVVGGATLVVTLAILIFEMLSKSAHISGIRLLTSSIALWVTNVIVFSLLYWQIDRGGPEARIDGAVGRADWLFPQEGAPAEVMPDFWHPVFIDYLYLAYSTATAFSTTEVAPLTPRAKLMMMMQSMISLITIVLVGARAINIIGG